VRASVVAYAYEDKTALLGVPKELLEAHGAVSEPVAVAMAEGIQSRTGADVAIGITGIAGPGGGSAEKPVGTVWLALDLRGTVETVLLRLWGDRAEVRQRSAQGALNLLRRALLGTD
jgi:nicotinamide-nucleotide amidase